MGNQQTGHESPKGYHVVEVSNNSPGSHAKVVPYFDVIVTANGTSFEGEDETFVNTLKENLHKEVTLCIYNIRSKQYRYTKLIPDDNWGGEGLTGLNVRLCTYQNILDFVWHVLVVQFGSPADEGGLESDVDYIIGSPEMVFSTEHDLYKLLESKIDKEVSLFVYSSVTGTVRLVTIHPRYGWRGDGKKEGGFLGCDIAFGLSHRLPPYEPRETTLEGLKVEEEKSSTVVPLFHVNDEKILSPKKTPMVRPNGSPSLSPLRPAMTTPPKITTPKVLPPMLLETQTEMGIPKPNGLLF